MRRLSLKTWILLILLVAAGLYGWRHWGPYPIANAHPTGRAIITFGDSLTFGTGAPEDRNYPAQLASLLGQPVLNRGVPGDTTTEALKRLDRDALQEDPKIVILCLGGNDLLRRVDSDTTFRNLEEMIARIQDKGALVVLIGLSGLPLNPGYEGRYRALARQTGCPFVPDILGGILGEPKLMSDQVHPNAEGYGLMARKIEGVVGKYVGE